MPKYAKDQSAGFSNAIEKVAIVGVSTVQDSRMHIQLICFIRLEALSVRISRPLFSKPESTQLQHFRERAAATSFLTVFMSPQSIMTMSLALWPH